MCRLRRDLLWYIDSICCTAVTVGSGIQPELTAECINLISEVIQKAVSLSKGQKVDLTKGNHGLKKLIVGLGWDTNKYDGGADFDLDAAAFLLGADGKTASDSDFVFYGNLKHVSEAVIHTGDNLTGDDEVIKVDLSKVPASVDKIDFTATIYEAEERHQNFGQVSNAYIRVVDEATNTELLKFDLGEDFSIETAVVAG